MVTTTRRQRVTVEDVGDVAVVHFVDKKLLDDQNIQMIGDDLFRLVDELGRRKLLLSFSNVDYMSSAALGKLISLHKRMVEVGGRLILCRVEKKFMDVVRLIQMDKLIKIVDDEATGLASF